MTTLAKINEGKTTEEILRAVSEDGASLEDNGLETEVTFSDGSKLIMLFDWTVSEETLKEGN